MSCLSPISIVNQTKFISPLYSQRMRLQVPCGNCAGCQKKVAGEWYYRALAEYRDTIETNGYMIMDCLTYSESKIPRLKDYFDCPDSKGRNKDKFRNTYCFDFKHVQDWKKLLRIRMERDGYDVARNLKFFIAAEYGTAENGTKRIHYHVLLYVRNRFIEPIQLSQYIAESWKYGRTDGVPYKGAAYLLGHCLIENGLTGSIRVCKYVTKYVQKHCKMQETLNKRVARLMFHLFENQFMLDDSRFSYDVPFGEDYDWKKHGNHAYKHKMKLDHEGFNEFMNSPRGKAIYRSACRRIMQFHKQSHGFGVAALKYIDYNLLVSQGVLSVVDNNKPVMFISCPTYYKRKMFYEKKHFLGCDTWQLNAAGLRYQRESAPYRRQKQRKNIEDAVLNLKMSLDLDKIDEIIRYKEFYRGRFKGEILKDASLDDIAASPVIYFSYISPSDKKHFGCKFVASEWLGSSQGYTYLDDAKKIPIEVFIRENTYYDPEMEKIIEKLDSYHESVGSGEQRYYEFAQNLKEIYASYL